MVNPISAIIYLLTKGILSDNSNELELFSKINKELDEIDSKNFYIARDKARENYPNISTEKKDDVFIEYTEKLSNIQFLLNEQSEKIIFEKYNLTPKQIKSFKEKRFLEKANNIKKYLNN